MKKKQHDEKIIAALDALDSSINGLQKYGSRYDEYIDQAALRGDDAKAKQLIKQKLSVFALIEQLRTLKGNIELGAYTSKAIAQLGKLPAAIAGCKGLLAESPDFRKLGKNITDIFKEMNKTEEEIAKLNDILSPAPANSYASRLEGEFDVKGEDSEEFKAEYAAMLDRLKGAVAPEPIAKPASAGPTGEIDYAGIIDEENKRH